MRYRRLCCTLGKPSSDRSIRIYSRDECEGVLKGIWSANGECTKYGGGSWSAICKYLN